MYKQISYCLCICRLQAVSFFRFSEGSARTPEGQVAKLGNLRNEAPIMRVVIFLAYTFRLTDQEKRETAHSLMHLLHHVDMIVLLTYTNLVLR